MVWRVGGGEGGAGEAGAQSNFVPQTFGGIGAGMGRGFWPDADDAALSGGANTDGS